MIALLILAYAIIGIFVWCYLSGAIEDLDDPISGMLIALLYPFVIIALLMVKPCKYIYKLGKKHPIDF